MPIVEGEYNNELWDLDHPTYIVTPWGAAYLGKGGLKFDMPTVSVCSEEGIQVKSRSCSYSIQLHYLMGSCLDSANSLYDMLNLIKEECSSMDRKCKTEAGTRLCQFALSASGILFFLEAILQEFCFFP